MPYQIFVVEDHLIMREAYVAILAAEPGLELCGVAASAEEALERLVGLACDLVVTDYRLPGLNGAELIRRLHAVRPELPAIVVSAHQDEAFVTAAREAGASAVLGKRDLVGTFGPTIEAVLAARHRAAA
ncbi:MAG TPA: response regulator transcription factor [Rubricoccaceae bacterium]|jgi:DNA-binding NarL/FixJ family response regulator